jgi:hypothetical protein
VRIDLAHRGSNQNGDNKQLKFKCQVQLEVAEDQKVSASKSLISNRTVHTVKTLQEPPPNKEPPILYLDQRQDSTSPGHMRTDSAPLLAPAEVFLQSNSGVKRTGRFQEDLKNSTLGYKQTTSNLDSEFQSL